jgi:hypothetical protein
MQGKLSLERRDIDAIVVMDRISIVDRLETGDPIWRRIERRLLGEIPFPIITVVSLPGT